ncbi:MAG: hypothetical protein FJ257_12685 [Phycisphaerae bacterium]|nr:hypothetical protein [Phycisphaerae bacterium]
MTSARSGSGDRRDGRGSRGSRGSEGKGGGIEPLWDPSKAIAGGFEWRRRGQLEPMLEQLRGRHGEAALWRLAIACLEPLRSQHELMPLVLDAAATAFSDPAIRSGLRSRFGGAASAAFMIGIKHELPNAASFLAGFRLLDDDPITAVADACAFARLAVAFRERERVLRAFPSRHSVRRRSTTGKDRARRQARALRGLISIDEEIAAGLLARVNRIGGERTRRVIGRLTELEVEAVAWLDQTTRLESILHEREGDEQEGGA